MTSAQAAPRWYWHDAFTQPEIAGLTSWIDDSRRGFSALFGAPLDDIKIHFHRYPRASEPVPWAETNKGNGRRADFHVDTRYSWNEFRSDWTAPHELSHLLFPYLGDDSRWFAEGIASYLQYQIMYANGTLTWEQTLARYEDSFRAARSTAGFDDVSIVEQSRRASSGGYARLYWGGAAYFLQADQRLFREHGLRLNDIIRKYGQCCYTAWGVDADGMIAIFDRLSDSTVFSDTYADSVVRPGFPATADALAWLRRNPPALQTERARRKAGTEPHSY